MSPDMDDDGGRKYPLRTIRQAACNRLRWIVQTEHLAVVVVGEGFGIPGPAHNGPQALLGPIGCHVVLELIIESASGRLVGRTFVEDAANMRCEWDIAQEMPLKKPLALIEWRARKPLAFLGQPDVASLDLGQAQHLECLRDRE